MPMPSAAFELKSPDDEFLLDGASITKASTVTAAAIATTHGFSLRISGFLTGTTWPPPGSKPLEEEAELERGHAADYATKLTRASSSQDAVAAQFKGRISMLTTLLLMTCIVLAIWFAYTARALWTVRSQWSHLTADTKAYFLMVAPPLTLALDLLMITDRLFYSPERKRRQPPSARSCEVAIGNGLKQRTKLRS